MTSYLASRSLYGLVKTGKLIQTPASTPVEKVISMTTRFVVFFPLVMFDAMAATVTPAAIGTVLSLVTPAAIDSTAFFMFGALASFEIYPYASLITPVGLVAWILYALVYGQLNFYRLK